MIKIQYLPHQAHAQNSMNWFCPNFHSAHYHCITIITRNTWQSLACSPTGTALSPPSEQ